MDTTGPDTGAINGPRGPGRLLEFGCWFLLLLACKSAVLKERPTWDAAFSVFPAAQILVDTGFSPGELFSRPGFWRLGPRTHAASPVTWWTALVLAGAPDLETAYLVLHVTQILLLALSLTLLRGLLSRIRPGPQSFLVVLVVAACPVVLVQAGMMYLEIPVLAAALWAVTMWVRQRAAATGVACAVACAFKITGVIVPAALALATLVHSHRMKRPSFTGLPRFLPSFAVTLALLFLTDMAAPTIAGHEGRGLLDYLDEHLLLYLRAVPDIALLTLAAFVLGVRNLLRTGTGPVLLAASCLVVTFVSFYLLVHLVGVRVYVLPRYFVLVIPFAFLLLVEATPPRFRSRALLVLLALFALNNGGRWYSPEADNRIAVKERSMEYLDHKRSHDLAVRHLGNIASGTPLYVGVVDHYLFRYPANGVRVPEGLDWRGIITADGPLELTIDDMPARFAVLDNFAWLGGERLRTLVEAAETSPDWTVRIEDFRRGRSRVGVIHVSRSTGSDD